MNYDAERLRSEVIVNKRPAHEHVEVRVLAIGDSFERNPELALLHMSADYADQTVEVVLNREKLEDTMRFLMMRPLGFSYTY